MNGRDLQKKLCLVCHNICDQTMARCPRCGARVSTRLNNSLSRSWALTITAALLYIPANILPMMTVSKFGSGQPDTIMSGIISLVNHSMVPICHFSVCCQHFNSFVEITGNDLAACICSPGQKT